MTYSTVEGLVHEPIHIVHMLVVPKMTGAQIKPAQHKYVDSFEDEQIRKYFIDIAFKPGYEYILIDAITNHVYL